MKIEKKIEQKIRNLYKNFSANFVYNLNTDIFMYLNVKNDFFKNKTKNDYPHTSNLKCIRLESIKNKNYDIDFEGFNFVDRYLYKNKQFFKEINQTGVLLNFLLYGYTDNTRLFLVEIDIPNSYETYDEIERKIKDTIENDEELHLTIHELYVNNKAGNIKNISTVLKTNEKKDVMYNFVRMVENEVQQISNFFSLISFKQFSKRGNSFLDKHYQNFLSGKPNDFKHYMEILFKPQTKNQKKIPRFNSEFKFPIRFYNIHSNDIYTDDNHTGDIHTGDIHTDDNHSDNIHSSNIKFIENFIKKPIDNKVSVIKNPIDNNISVIKNPIDNNISVIKNSIDNNIFVIKNSIDNNISVVKNSIDNNISVVKNSIDNISVIKNPFDNNISVIKNPIDNNISVIKNLIDNNISVINNDTLVQNINDSSSSPLLSSTIYSNAITNSDNDEISLYDDMNLINQYVDTTQLIDPTSTPSSITPFGTPLGTPLELQLTFDSPYTSPFTSPFGSPDLSTLQMEDDQTVHNQNIDV